MQLMHFLNRLAVIATVISASAKVAVAQATVNINWNDTRQTIDGFGTAQGGSYPDRIYDHPQRTQIMDLAFSPTIGIGLSIFRAEVMTSMEPALGQWNDTPSCTPAPASCDSTNLDPACACKQAWIMKEASNRGAKLMGSVWTPPAWMKNNGSEVQGSLLDTRRQDFADYLKHYVTTYAANNGFTIYGVSVQNEPDAVVGWRSCLWTANQIATFLGSFLSPTFGGVRTKVIAPETSGWDAVESYLGPTYSNSTARNRLDIAAGHQYFGTPTTYFSNAKSYGKSVWQTEDSLGLSGSHHVWNIDGALDYAKKIHDTLTGDHLANPIVPGAEANAWLWWILGQENADPNNDGALLSFDKFPNPTSFTVSKTFWALGNFSKFIRPGFVRMTTGATPTNLYVTAYRDPTTDQFVIVAINMSYSTIYVTFDMQGMWTNEVTPYITSETQNLQALPTTYLQNQAISGRSIVTYVSRTRNFELWASAPHAQVVSGDFNGDGKADIALAGGDGWSTVPVALSNGNGTFTVKNYGIWDFALWANGPGAQVAAGDVNGDGCDDLVVTGVQYWTTVPVAVSNCDGSFHSVNEANDSIPALSRIQGAKLLLGDVNNDGRDDLILVGGAGWSTIPVGFASATYPGRFVACPTCSTGSVSYWTTSGAGPFTTWAQDPYAKPFVTDFNGDGRADIVLMSGGGWYTVPLAIANSGNTFTVYNQANSNLATWSQAPGEKTLSGCRRTVPITGHSSWHHCSFGGDWLGDLALTGGAGWTTIPAGFYAGSGNFNPVTNSAVANFPGWAQDSSARAVSGDFDGNGKADIALIGGFQWWTVPIAWSQGGGTFSVTNLPID